MTGSEAFSADKIRQYAIAGGSLGAGMAIVMGIFNVIASDPKFSGVVLSWGPLFLISIIVIAIGDRRMGQMVEIFRASTEVQRDAAAQSQRLADAVQKISERDDERSREMDLVTAGLARNSQAILESVHATNQQVVATQRQLAAIQQQLSGMEQTRAYGQSAH